MALYIVSRGLSASVAGSFFAVASVVIVTVRLLGARWLSRFPTQVFLVCGYVLLIAACVLLPLVGSVPGILGVGLLYGAAHGVIWMTLGSEAVRLAPPERRGAANATFYFAFDAAIGLGAAFWGSMIDYWYTKDGILRYNYGIENQDYTIEEDGSITISDIHIELCQVRFKGDRLIVDMDVGQLLQDFVI